MNGGGAGDAAAAGAAAPHALQLGAGDARGQVPRASFPSDAENAAFSLDQAATGDADARALADAWASVALEGDARAKRFKMDTSGIAFMANMDLSLPPPPGLAMALGGGASAFTISSGSDMGMSPMNAALLQHARQHQMEQEQRQRALQDQAQVAASAQAVPLYGVQPPATQYQPTAQGGGAAAEPMGQQSVAYAGFPGANDLKFTIPVAQTGAVQHQAMASQWIQHQQQQQQHAQQLQPTTLASSIPVKEAAGAPVTAAATSHACLICKNEGGVFSCQGGCGLHAHPKCIGEDVIVQFSVGQLCGNCFIMQQDRNLREDLTKGDAPRLSVRRAILWLNLETNNPLSFEKFGHMTSLRLWEIGRVAGYPIKPFAEKFAEPYLQRWMREKLVNVDKWQLSVHEVFTLLLGLYGLKCTCISHDRLARVVELIKARNLSVTDFLGWHPAIESPNVRCSAVCPICGIRNAPELNQCARCKRNLLFPSVYMKYASALLASFYAENVGVPLGTTLMDVFAHTNTVRQAYKGLAPIDADGIPWEIFVDQLRMIYGLLDVMSDFGSLQLNVDLFGPEVAILFNGAYIHRAILLTDFEIVGRTLQCMKLFGGVRIDAQRQLMDACERFLLMRQMPNGSWCKIGGSAVDQYKATVACAKALVTPKFRGHGPLSADCQRLLEKWADSFKTGVQGKTQPVNDKEADKLLVCGAVIKSGARGNLKRLEAMYKRQLVPERGANAMEHFVSARMRSLVRAKKLKVESTEEEDEQPVEVKADEVKAEVKAEVKSEVKGESDQQLVKREDDDALTNMSLSEDLEIFDGLKFEDGDVIDLNHHHDSLAANADEDDGDADEHADAEAGEDTQVDDEIGDDDMYDDDDEENDDGSGEDDHEQPNASEAVDVVEADDGEVPEVPEVPLEDSSALL